MSTLINEFRTWALDPTRTNEELFTVELLIEWARVVWGWKHQDPENYSWDVRTAKMRARRLNPAYRAKINEARLEKILEVWADVKKISSSYGDDRPIRDLSALHFFPHLEEVELRDCEVVDFSVLAELKNLRTLNVNEPNLGGGHCFQSLEAVSGLPCLDTLTLNVRTPWPDLRALSSLPALKTLSLSTNLITLQEVGPLNAVEVATLHGEFHMKTPPRSVRDLPEMPLVRRLDLECVASLDGIERYTQVQNLVVEGSYRDLTPLGSLHAMTSLHLKGDRYTDLAPLCKAKNLRKLEMDRKRPLDVSVLSDAAELREVTMPQCPMMATELSALQAALTPWSHDFSVDPPRELPPLRFICYRREDEDFKRVQLARSLQRNQEYSRAPLRDTALDAAEERWLVEEVCLRLDHLLGIGWGLPNGNHIRIRRIADVMKYREIVQALREVSARSKKPQSYLLIVEPHGDMSDDMQAIRKRHGEKEDWLSRPFNAEQEKEEWEDYRKGRLEERAFLEREHRMRLLEQEGMEINPEEFAPEEGRPRAEKVAAGDVAENKNDDDEEDDTDENDEDGDLLTPPPEDSTSELAEDLGFYSILSEDTLLVASTDVENAAYSYGEPPLDWATLPEPPEERPLPHF